jgi:hypothetical protein
LCGCWSWMEVKVTEPVLGWMKYSLMALPLLLLVVAVLPGTFVYAQTNTTTRTPEEESTTAANTTTGNATTTTPAPIQQLVTPPSSTAQQIINNTQAECEQAQFSPRKCVILVYESPTTVVLNGEVLIFGGSAESIGNYPNSFLWRAVDGFKA